MHALNSIRTLSLIIALTLPGIGFAAGNSTLIQLVGNVTAVPQQSQLSVVSTSASSGCCGFGPGLTIDGSFSTRWGSAIGVDPAWITLDLGSSQDLSSVTIYWEAANADTYEIRGSNDNSNWTTLATKTGGLFGDRTDTLAIAGNYRYVQMYGISRSVGNAWGYSIWEMEVYGTAIGGGAGHRRGEQAVARGRGGGAEGSCDCGLPGHEVGSWLGPSGQCGARLPLGNVGREDRTLLSLDGRRQRGSPIQAGTPRS